MSDKSGMIPNSVIDAYIKFCQLASIHEDDTTDEGVALREASEYFGMDRWELNNYSREVKILFMNRNRLDIPPRTDPVFRRHENVFVNWMRKELEDRRFLVGYTVMTERKAKEIKAREDLDELAMKNFAKRVKIGD